MYSARAVTLQILQCQHSTWFATKGEQGVSPLIPKISKILPFCWMSPSFVPCQKIESPLSFKIPTCPSLGHRLVIAFRQISSKISPAVCIFRSTITTYLKNLVRIKSLNSIQNILQQDYFPELCPPVPPLATYIPTFNFALYPTRCGLFPFPLELLQKTLFN